VLEELLDGQADPEAAPVTSEGADEPVPANGRVAAGVT